MLRTNYDNMTNFSELQQNLVNLVAAIESGALLQVKRLIDAGVDVNKCSPSLGPLPPLGYAVAYGHVEIVQTSLSAGAYPHGYILLQLQPNSEKNTLQILSLLVDAGINVNFKLEEADTLLMKAAGRGELDLVKLLLEAGADVNQTNQFGECALMFAAYAGWQEVYEYLAPLTSQELRAEPEKYFPDGLLHRQRKNDRLSGGFISAAAMGELDAVLGAIEKGVNINTIGAEGNTALYIASAGGHVSVVRALIEAGADINLGTENYGTTPLIASVNNIAIARHYGRNEAETRQMKVVRLLIKAGADVNAETTDGWTALMAAANVGSLEAIELLLAAGADVNSKHKDEDTAVSRAKAAGHNEIVQLLREVGATED